jgi:hyperosmotically inducible periplasmic protein
MRKQYGSLLSILATGVAALALSACATNPDTSQTASGTDKDRSAGQFMDDAALTAKVGGELAKHSEVDKKDINVQSYNGTVQLAGFVDTQREKDLAGQIAGRVGGVRSVRNDLRLKDTAGGDRDVSSSGHVDHDRSGGTTMDDGAITTKVAAELAKDNRVDKKDINVQTYNGIVQLSGFADSAGEKEAAGQAASRVEGVRSVRNDIVLK